MKIIIGCEWQLQAAAMDDFLLLLKEHPHFLLCLEAHMLQWLEEYRLNFIKELLWYGKQVQKQNL